MNVFNLFKACLLLPVFSSCHTVPENKKMIVTDNVPDSIYLNEISFESVTNTFYVNDTVIKNKTVMTNGKPEINKIVEIRKKNTVWPDQETDHDTITMYPLHLTFYTENQKEKAAVFFYGDFFYQHGHTWYTVEVFFFENENKRWKFIDSIHFEDADIGEITNCPIYKQGFALHVNSEW